VVRLEALLGCIVRLARLVGATIEEIWVSPDQSSIIFVARDVDWNFVKLCFDTTADCCSETWFTDIVGVSALLAPWGTAIVGGCERFNVTGYQWISMDGYNVEDGRSRQESDEAYGERLVTNQGYCDFIYRNSSNGYYGGDLRGPVNVAAVPDGWTKITEDWRA
jgi:hypothetical protein